MGFFSNFGKALMGQPTPGAENTLGTAAGSDTHDAKGYRIVPTMILKDVRSHRNGNNLTVTAWVMNDCDHEIRVDYCHMLKQKQQFNQVLSPRQSRQVILYQGIAPKDENEHSANIVYRLQSNGDSFQKSYTVRYHLESDGTRTVDELQDEGPIRDI